MLFRSHSISTRVFFLEESAIDVQDTGSDDDEQTSSSSSSECSADDEEQLKRSVQDELEESKECTKSETSTEAVVVPPLSDEEVQLDFCTLF